MGVHKLCIRNRKGAEGKITTGHNACLTLDDKPLKSVTSLTIKLSPTNIAEINITMIAELDIELNTDDEGLRIVAEETMNDITK